MKNTKLIGTGILSLIILLSIYFTKEYSKFKGYSVHIGKAEWSKQDDYVLFITGILILVVLVVIRKYGKPNHVEVVENKIIIHQDFFRKKIINLEEIEYFYEASHPFPFDFSYFYIKIKGKVHIGQDIAEMKEFKKVLEKLAIPLK